MADFRYDYDQMRTAANDIRSYAGEYKTAASTFQNDFTQATSGWEGVSKDKMKNFIDVPVMEYMRDTVPDMLTALAELLDFNASQMESADNQIADAIPSSLAAQG